MDDRLPSIDQSPDICAINVLPDEILSDILSLATHDHDNDGRRYRFPAVLCQVSRRWCAVTYASPRVWSFIYIDEAVHPHTRTRLTRAGSAPLEVKILGDEGTLVPDDVMELLLPTSSQWSAFHLMAEHLRLFLSSFPSDLPLLRTLSLAGAGAQVNVDFRLPQVRYMHLEAVWLSWTSPVMFPNLTEFKASYYGGSGYKWVHVDKLLDCLASSPNLEVVQLTHPWDFEPVTPEEYQELLHRIIVLPRLKAFRADALYSWELAMLLSLLRFPALETLLLNIAPNNDNPPSSFSIDQLHLDFPYLQTLIIKDVRIPNEEFRHILLQLPEVSQLSLIDLHYTSAESIFKMIFLDPTLAKLVSRLSMLTTRGVSLETAHECFCNPSLSSATRSLLRTLTWKLHQDDLPGRGEPEGKVLLELRSLVSHIESTREEFWWD